MLITLTISSSEVDVLSSFVVAAWSLVSRVPLSGDVVDSGVSEKDK